MVSAVVLSFVDPVILPPVSDLPVLRFTARMLASDQPPGTTSVPCDLHFADIAGSGAAGEAEGGGASIGQGIQNAVPVGGETLIPDFCDLAVRLRKNEPPRFRRGDTNDDGVTNVADPVTTLGYLFLGREALGCRDAADTDDNGELNLSDAVFELSFLFLSGAPPPSPGPRACGEDPTADTIGCAATQVSCGE